MNTNERVLAIIKPDALEGGHLLTIKEAFIAEKMSVNHIGYVVFDLPLIMEFYQWLKIEHPQAIESYICHQPMPVWIIEGVNAVAKTLSVKKCLRREMQKSRLKNLLHCSETEAEFEWQLNLLKRRNLIMSEIKTKNQVQVIVFRCTDSGETQFLMLKRNERKGGFWQSVTGNVRPGEAFEAAALREVGEELGITKVKLVDAEYSFEFTEAEKVMFERVFGAMVSNDQSIELSDEHTEFKWVSANEALNTYLKYPGNKEGLRRLSSKIQPSVSEEGVRK